MQLVFALLNKLMHLFLCLFVWMRNIMLSFYWWRSIKQKRPLLYNISNGCHDMKADMVLNGFSKVPIHIAFIFPDENVINIDILNQLLFWSYSCRIPTVSLYDIHGKIRGMYQQLRTVPSLNAFSPNFLDFDKGVHNIRGPKVHVLSGENGRPAFVEMVQQSALTNQKLSSKYIDQYFMDHYGFTSPDMAVIVGDYPISSYGYPPWSLRFTEFYSLTKVCAESFTELLHRFSKTEQRYGR